jgi:hypothetical protein
MFHLLSAIDGVPLPAKAIVSGTEHSVGRGGLLLEPPSSPYSRGDVDGYAVMQFFTSTVVGSSDSFDGIAASAEPYRIVDGTVDVSRSFSSGGSRFTGTIDGDRIRLRMLGDSRLLPSGTLLDFVAAPEAPVTADWSSTFNFGPPIVQPHDPTAWENPEYREHVAQWLAAGEAERLRVARVRLEAAWVAPVVGG